MTSHPSDLELWVGAAEQHLSTCARCAARLETVSAQQRDTSQRLAAALGGPVDPPPEVERRLAEALAADRVFALPARRWGRWVAGAGVAAAAVVVVGLVVPQVLGDQLRSVGSYVSAPEVSADDQAGGGAALAPQEADAPPPLPPDLRTSAQGLVTGPQAPGVDGCGSALAAELQGQVLATGPAGDREGVLVVIRTGEGTGAWWLPSCEAGAAAAFGNSSLP
jgi:anti-sigma factor RsiW